MKTNNQKLTVGVLALAVQGALIAMASVPAQAQDATVADLTTPDNYVEIGISNTSDKSAKFGEYNGLNKKGADLIGNFSVKGGAYGSETDAKRWSVHGSDLGTDSRELGATISNQGQWKLGINYDELRHNISDSYQTPQQGSMGGNAFTLSPNFGTYNGQANPSTRTLNATQLGAFHTEDVSSTRKNTSLNAGYIFNPQFSLNFDYNHLDQSGAKLIAGGALGGAAASAPSAGTWRGESVAVLMNPTNYTTDTFNLALNWTGDKGFMTAGYYGSLFKDGYDRLTWNNAALSTAGITTCASGGGNCTYELNTMSTMPDNQFHQFNLTGGYTLSPATKLAGGLSYGRNTQNDSFLTNQMWGALPKSSLDGLVVTTHADLKLTNQTTKDLTLSAGMKYNKRDNRTSSDTYKFTNIAGGNDTATSAPLSYEKRQYELAADYRLGRNNKIHVAYENESYKRWCNNYATDGNNPGGANCLVSPSNNEDKLNLTYRRAFNDAVQMNIGYTYADRKSEFDHLAVTPIGVTVGLGIINAADVVGFVPAFEASRKQDILKAGVNWQASEKLSFGISGKYANDKYTDSPLGVQNGRTQGVNLDAAYNYAANGTVSAYFTWQNRKRDLRSAEVASNASSKTTYAALAGIAVTGIWTNAMEDDGSIVGITFDQKELLGGKLALNGDLSYSDDKTSYSTSVPYNAACSGAGVLTCGSLPDITSKVLRMKLTGTYQLDKVSKIAAGYIYQNRKSNDYYYNTYQYGYTPNRVMPTNEQAPNYNQNVIFAAYNYSFK
jgi:MtrB/PioB family decaheme-associated outer membrane protein